MPDLSLVLLATTLLVFSALCSGLTLGLLGLDVYSLEITLASDTVQAKYAAKILPLRRRGNLLLCTLLFANVAVNVALPILLTKLFGEVGSLLLSVSLIVVVGEIIPQAICSRYALPIGAHSRFFVYILMLLFAPIAYPVSRLLDLLLGDELGQMYSRKELQKLVEIHHHTNHAQKLHDDEFNIMTGALQFGAKKVNEIMTPLSAIFSVDINDRLDFETMKSIFESGYSRIPVINRLENGKPSVAGILYAKDLILVDPGDALPIRHILGFYHRTVHFVSSDFHLERLLSEFKSGRTHMAVVVDVTNQSQGEKWYEMRGLVTLEDIVEVIFQDNILDETDIAPLNPAPRQLDRQWLIWHPFTHQSISRLQGMELDAVCFHLRGAYPSVFQVLDEQYVHRLLQRSMLYEVEVPDRNEASRFSEYGREIESEIEHRSKISIDEGGLVLYDYGEEMRSFSLVLEGRVRVKFGTHRFESELGRWSVLGLYQFELDSREIVRSGDVADIELADFTAVVERPSRILRIDLELYRRYLKKSSGISAHAGAIRDEELPKGYISPTEKSPGSPFSIVIHE